MSSSHPIVLSRLQKSILQGIIHQTDSPSPIAKRARIILASDKGKTVNTIAKELKLHPSSINHYRRQWRDMIISLNRAELNGDLDALRQTIETALASAKRNNDTSTLTDTQMSQILAIWEEDPLDSGRSIEFWTVKTVAEEAVNRGIVERLSTQKLSYLLRKISFRPPSPRH